MVERVVKRSHVVRFLIIVLIVIYIELVQVIHHVMEARVMWEMMVLI